MPFIPGYNNGEWGLNASRGAMFPAGIPMNGPFGMRGYPLPVNLQMPTGTVDKPYMGRAFGNKMVYELTPGGVTTSEGWGFIDKSRRFGSKRKSRSGVCRRCKGITKSGKQCKHICSFYYTRCT